MLAPPSMGMSAPVTIEAARRQRQGLGLGRWQRFQRLVRLVPEAYPEQYSGKKVYGDAEPKGFWLLIAICPASLSRANSKVGRAQSQQEEAGTNNEQIVLIPEAVHGRPNLTGSEADARAPIDGDDRACDECCRR